MESFAEALIKVIQENKELKSKLREALSEENQEYFEIPDVVEYDLVKDFNNIKIFNICKTKISLKLYQSQSRFRSYEFTISLWYNDACLKESKFKGTFENPCELGKFLLSEWYDMISATKNLLESNRFSRHVVNDETIILCDNEIPVDLLQLYSMKFEIPFNKCSGCKLIRCNEWIELKNGSCTIQVKRSILIYIS